MANFLRRLFGSGKGESKGGGKTAKDPVCGMDVDVNKPAATSVHQGQTYYFCAVGCKKAFDENPDKYLSAEGEAKGGMHSH